MRQVGAVLQNQPDLSVPINNDRATTWLLVTYLDKDMRITRGDGGAVFVFQKTSTVTSVVKPAAVPEVTIETTYT